jgi:hypothetical protein
VLSQMARQSIGARIQVGVGNGQAFHPHRRRLGSQVGLLLEQLVQTAGRVGPQVVESALS